MLNARRHWDILFEIFIAIYMRHRSLWYVNNVEPVQGLQETGPHVSLCDQTLYKH